ncbi:MAG: capsule biosynthesis GfcC family protein [Pseudoxanthomonas sp.]
MIPGKPWLCALAFVVAVPAMAQTAPGSLHASVEGAVQRPGGFDLPAGARLADAVLAAMPNRHAYPLGAALLRRDAALEQARTRAGLSHDLGALAALPDIDPQTAALIAGLRAWLDALPATGRVPALLEPRALEVDPAANRPLADGDRFVYPARPGTVRVVGAVAQPCELPQVPLRDARDYLDDCAPAKAADRDWLYAIQPDGRVQRLGIAAWNRSAPQPLAPGALVYVPLAERTLREVSPAFNREMAGFLATQHLPAAEAAP